MAVLCAAASVASRSEVCKILEVTCKTLDVPAAPANDDALKELRALIRATEEDLASHARAVEILDGEAGLLERCCGCAEISKWPPIRLRLVWSLRRLSPSVSLKRLAVFRFSSSALTKSVDKDPPSLDYVEAVLELRSKRLHVTAVAHRDALALKKAAEVRVGFAERCPLSIPMRCHTSADSAESVISDSGLLA